MNQRGSAGRRSALLLSVCCAIASILAVATPGVVHATRLRSLNVEQLADRAGRIIAGRCIAVEAVPGETRLPVVRVTVRVERTLKGTHHDTLSFQVVGRPPADQAADGALGAPRFAPDEELILFLYPESDLGLTSTVGLGQGKFVIRDGKDGRVAVNGFGNAGLLRDVGPATRESLAGEAVDRLSPEDLLATVERLQGGTRRRP